MFVKKNNHGFTLIEMLVVIAIIAVLVSIIIPTVTAATVKAEAATDAANLRSVMGQLNGVLAAANEMSAAQAQGLQTAESRMYPDAKMLIVYSNPGFIDAYYLDEDTGNYYGLNYFSAIAKDGANGADGISTDAPVAPAGQTYEWYEAGVGAYTTTP